MMLNYLKWIVIFGTKYLSHIEIQGTNKYFQLWVKEAELYTFLEILQYFIFTTIEDFAIYCTLYHDCF